jgi:murein DD-endopeptidase MepM/ murein hydrolase activator NlpD
MTDAGTRTARLAHLALALALGGCGGRTAAPDGPPVDELLGVWYTVEAGDTVGTIAKRHDVPVEDVVELNGLEHPDRLEVGQVLFLYGIDEIVRRLPPASGGRSTDAAESSASAARPGKTKPLVWPVETGTLSSRFGRRWGRMHKGVDVAAEPGTPIVAAAAGEVVYSDNKQRGYGNLVIIRHKGGLLTVYAHNRRNLVDVGQTVRQGSRIAEVGNTGRSTGPHLHFEVRVDGKAVDPLPYLPPRR